MAEEHLAQRFINLFTGMDRAYGRYEFDNEMIATDGEKRKGHGVTIREDILPEFYTQHLDGDENMMLGVIPIMDGNTCKFGAIDIDDYNVDIPKVLTLVRDMNLPLIGSRSKSGGLHLWAFFIDAIPARAVKAKLEEICDAIGYPNIEVFPKQHQIGPADVGNWINLPWFDHESTDRYGFNREGEEVHDLAAWLDLCEEYRISLRDLNRLQVGANPDAGERPFADGPPCLQTLAERGITEGMRNNVMFSMGVYAHHKHGDDAIAYMHQFNAEHFDPRIDDREVERIRTSVDDGGYRYPCTQAPISEVCNRTLCLRRRWGVRLNGETFNFGTLFQYVPVTIDGDELSDECHWKLQINYNEEEHQLELTTDELLQARAVRKKAVNRRITLPPFANDEWNDLMEAKIQNCEVVQVPEEVSSIGVLRYHIAGFLDLRGSGTESKLEIEHGKAWLNEEEERYWFKLELLRDYLQTQRYNDYTGSRLAAVLRDRFGFQEKRPRLEKGKDGTRIWTCPATLRLKRETGGEPTFREEF